MVYMLVLEETNYWSGNGTCIDSCLESDWSSPACIRCITLSTLVSLVATHQLLLHQTLHQLTARAVIRDWTEGSLDSDRTQHEVHARSLSYTLDLCRTHVVRSYKLHLYLQVCMWLASFPGPRRLGPGNKASMWSIVY